MYNFSMIINLNKYNLNKLSLLINFNNRIVLNRIKQNYIKKQDFLIKYVE